LKYILSLEVINIFSKISFSLGFKLMR
jgi:hypothetical protein